MRHLLFALLIALLPLRGWVGDAMATQMAAGQMQHSQKTQKTAIKTVASHAHGAGATGHFDHEETAQTPQAAEPDCAGHSTGSDTHAANGHCESCAACQACHTVALSLMRPDLSPAIQSLTLTRPVTDPFASADVALRHKPPIS